MIEQLNLFIASLFAPLSLYHPLVIIPLNVCAFWLGLQLYRRTRSPLLHPIVGACLLVFVSLWLLGISYPDYQNGSSLLYLLLGPSVVALAIPLQQNLPTIRRAGWPLLVTAAIGALLAPLVAILIALPLGAGRTVLLALSTKAVTTPIALTLADKIHSIYSLTTGVILMTGVVSAVFGPQLLRRFGIADPMTVGFALGVNGHAISTVRALEISALCGAFAALAMGLCGAITAILLPLLLLG